MGALPSPGRPSVQGEGPSSLFRTQVTSGLELVRGLWPLLSEAANKDVVNSLCRKGSLQYVDNVIVCCTGGCARAASQPELLLGLKLRALPYPEGELGKASVEGRGPLPVSYLNA